jgi:hypothetical protein
VADRDMLLGAVLLTVSTGFGAAVSLREGVHGEPLRVRLPGGIGTHLAVGYGSGLSAPWPMPAAALVAGFCARPGRDWPARTIRTVGWLLVAGTLVEPVTWGRRARSPAVVAAVAANLVAAAVLVRSAGSAPSRPV